jgi:hypothetical protein
MIAEFWRRLALRFALLVMGTLREDGRPATHIRGQVASESTRGSTLRTHVRQHSRRHDLQEEHGEQGGAVQLLAERQREGRRLLRRRRRCAMPLLHQVRLLGDLVVPDMPHHKWRQTTVAITIWSHDSIKRGAIQKRGGIIDRQH